MSKDELFDKIKSILVNEFEIDEAAVTPAAKLGDELDMDSIDFIDLIGKTKEFIPGKINPDIFKTVKTVQDIIDALQPYTEA